ncbi:MAG TPA: hypothetical protein VJ732_09515 [Bryobacteraceae bacterium]|nr:hypothetical protein [Bryobacteraceae bacterium]
MRIFAILAAILGLLQSAAAQNADDYRGGWETVAGGVPRIYEFSIRGDQVRGIYCTHCSDGTTLAFLDGKLAGDGLSFVVTHVDPDGATVYQDHAIAKFHGGQLTVTGTSGGPGGGKFEWAMHKDPRGPDPLPVPVSRLPKAPPVPAVPAPGGARPPAPYVPPGPWVTITPAKLVGVWIGFGAGINKQFFIIRRVGGRLRGMVCGRCDNPYTMAALDDFQIQGDTLKFNILHEDWGPGPLPFHNQITAHVVSNEMRITFVQDNLPPRPPRPGGGASLMGPIAIEATAGNP